MIGVKNVYIIFQCFKLGLTLVYPFSR